MSVFRRRWFCAIASAGRPAVANKSGAACNTESGTADHAKSGASDYSEPCSTDYAKPGATDHSQSGAADHAEPRAANARESSSARGRKSRAADHPKSCRGGDNHADPDADTGSERFTYSDSHAVLATGAAPYQSIARSFLLSLRERTEVRVLWCVLFRETPGPVPTVIFLARSRR